MKTTSLYEIMIPNEWNGKTLHQYLRQGLRLSRSQIRALKKANGILLNNQVVWVSHILLGGESLTLHFCLEKQNIPPEDIELEIVYEDSDMVVVNKPAEMVVHPVKKHQSGTLANALIYHWQTNHQPASFHPVHRLDRLTTGLVIIAKNPWIHQQLDLQIQSGKLHRFYLAICYGIPSHASGRIDAPIKSFIETPRREIAPDGQSALTRYRILKSTSKASMVAIKLYSGRTHQIRVHMAHLGNPLWGDPLYGLTDPNFPRPALHAAKIQFKHPRTQEIINLQANIPNDFNQLWESLS